MRKVDLTGSRFGRLVVLYEGNKKGKNTTWHCKCDCGTVIKRFSQYGRERKYVVGHNNYARRQNKRQGYVGE